jgi:hypothetical protein
MWCINEYKFLSENIVVWVWKGKFYKFILILRNHNLWMPRKLCVEIFSTYVGKVDNGWKWCFKMMD